MMNKIKYFARIDVQVKRGKVIIQTYNIANPQWTRTYEDSPEWMKLGFSIFSALTDFPLIYEVFPSASYRMLEKENVQYELCLNEFSGVVKDMLDAFVTAITVYKFIDGRGCQVGGKDELGTIVLPGKVGFWLTMSSLFFCFIKFVYFRNCYLDRVKI